MVTVLIDIQALMNVVPVGTTWTFFRIYEMETVTVQKYLDMAIRYCNEQISAATQALKPLVYDDLTLVESCLRIMDHIYSEYMATGFSWSTLADSVNTGNYGQMIAGRIAQFTQQKEHYLSVLKMRYDLSTQENWGDDPYDVIGNNFNQTANFRSS